MNEATPMNRLREAMRNANIDELDEEAEEIGRQAVAIALASPERPPAPRPDPEDERQRILDALAGDLDEVANRHRARLGRRVCSASDVRIKRVAFEHFR